jgi:hypothetical protein
MENTPFKIKEIFFNGKNSERIYRHYMSIWLTFCNDLSGKIVTHEYRFTVTQHFHDEREQWFVECTNSSFFFEIKTTAIDEDEDYEYNINLANTEIGKILIDAIRQVEENNVSN